MTIAELIRQECLPEGFVSTVERYYRPLAERIGSWHQGRPLLIGVNGGQGTGKSTLALFLRELLETEQDLATAVLSIDDLYLTRAERMALGQRVHPLLATRGVPGTHDPALGLRVIEALMRAEGDLETPLPRFAKGMDDRVPEPEWPLFHGRADVVILEGWCVGARAQAAAELVEPVNELERDEDADGAWRGYVNEQLAGPYRPLFERIDHLVMLRAPGMDCIRAWRGEQEHKLRQRLLADGGDMSQLMDGPALDRFIAHYQRLTEHQWRDLPTRADAVLSLAEDHRITGMKWKGVAS